MKRFLLNDLISWKRSNSRKPLIINGARQVGKTWLIREFARKEFDQLAYINFESSSNLRDLFEQDFDVRRIITGIEIATGLSIDPANTLIAFDEIQEAPKALTSLKYFCENAPEYHIVAAGSLLGVTMHEGSSFPVGKVETLNLYPLSFEEFLLEQAGENFLDLLKGSDLPLLEAFKPQIVMHLRNYFFIGGMPEAVSQFGSTMNYAAARKVQLRILGDYERDFSKHQSGKGVERTLAVWESIPTHLAQENKRFVFGRISHGSRAKDFESAITWLTQAGLIYKIPRISKPGIPLNAYRDVGAFKIYTLDIGLLGAMSQIDVNSIIEGNSLFTEFKGSLTEQFICQELIASCKLSPYYWSAENSRGEIDFLIQMRNKVYALEVKAEENLKAKSLRSFKQKWPDIIAIRFSLSNYREESWMKNIPLFLVGNTDVWC